MRRTARVFFRINNPFKHILLLVSSHRAKNFVSELEICLMEFFCVLSVGGSLASYHVQQEAGKTYKAVLRTNNGQRDDIPAEIILEKSANGWRARPWHEEIVSSLINAVESNGQ